MREKSKQNPLFSGLRVPVARRIRRRGSAIDSQPGPDREQSRVVVDAQVDIEPYVKLYRPIFRLLCEMSEPGRKVFSLLLAQVEQNCDTVDLSIQAFTLFTGNKSSSTLCKGIQNLSELKVISKAPKRSAYYINPSMVFSGSRLKLMSAAETAESDTPSQQEQ